MDDALGEAYDKVILEGTGTRGMHWEGGGRSRAPILLVLMSKHMSLYRLWRACFLLPSLRLRFAAHDDIHGGATSTQV